MGISPRVIRNLRDVGVEHNRQYKMYGINFRSLSFGVQEQANPGLIVIKEY